MSADEQRSVIDGDALRELVRETLRDALPSLLTAPTGAGAQRVSLRDDADLAAFVSRVVALADDPVTADDLRAGRIRFALDAPTSAVGPSVEPAEHRVTRGAVLERHVRAAAADGARIVVAPRVVVTPLARDRARASGVEIVRQKPDGQTPNSANRSGGR